MRRRGSLATPLLLALVLYSTWSPSAFVASPPPRPRRVVSLWAAGDDDVALRNLLLGDISSAGVKASTKVKEAVPAKKAPAAKVKEAAPAKKEAAPAPKAAEKVPAKVAKAPADDVKAPTEKKGAAAAQSESPMTKAVSEPAGDSLNVLTKNDQGLWRFVEVDRDAALLAAFKSFDLNGDGELDREELKEAAAKFGESEKQIGELLKQFDVKGNGSISLDEFKNLITSAEEACDVEQEMCFSLRKPSTWGLLFRSRRK